MKNTRSLRKNGIYRPRKICYNFPFAYEMGLFIGVASLEIILTSPPLLKLPKISVLSQRVRSPSRARVQTQILKACKLRQRYDETQKE